MRSISGCLPFLWPRLILFPPRSKLHPFLFKALYMVGGLASKTSLPFIASWRSVHCNIYPNLLGIGPSSAFRAQAEQRHDGCFRNVVHCRNNCECKPLTSHLACMDLRLNWLSSMSFCKYCKSPIVREMFPISGTVSHILWIWLVLPSILFKRCLGMEF